MSGQVWPKPEGPQRGLSRTQLPPPHPQTEGRTSTFLSGRLHPLIPLPLTPAFSEKKLAH